MLSIADLQRVPVYKAVPEKRATRRDGTPREPERLGKIHFAVFTPGGTRVVGFMIKQPDVAGMIKRPDVFVALDCVHPRDGLLVVDARKDAYDKAAIERLKLDFDRCVMWVGMDVRTVSGKRLGYCADAVFDFASGKVGHFVVAEGAASQALVGSLELPVAMVQGYDKGFMVVSDDAADLALTGGVAAKAAEASVVAGAKAKEAAKKLDDSASAAVSKGSKALGKQLKKSKGMFAAFKSEYQRAAGTAKKKR